MPATHAEIAAAEAFFGPVMLTLPRLLALFTVLPFFSGRVVNGLARGGLLLTLAIFMSPVAGPMPDTSPALWLLLTAKEVLIGLLLGLGFGIFIWAIESVGDLIDFQTGSSNALFFDPAAGHEGGPTGTFLAWLVITLFVSAGGLLALLGVVVDSYRIWPVTSFMPDLGAVLQEFVVRQGDTLFQLIVKLASPVILVLLLAELGMGLVGRIAPQLNVFVFSQPLKSLLAHLMMLLFLFLLYDSLQIFLRPENGVLDFLRHTL
ncbi:MAG: type III secretion system export apparatus subunit SctT [Pseudomonadota bacterium]